LSFFLRDAFKTPAFACFGVAGGFETRFLACSLAATLAALAFYLVGSHQLGSRIHTNWFDEVREKTLLRAALEELTPLVYEELRRVAHDHLRRATELAFRSGWASRRRGCG